MTHGSPASWDQFDESTPLALCVFQRPPFLVGYPAVLAAVLTLFRFHPPHRAAELLELLAHRWTEHLTHQDLALRMIQRHNAGTCKRETVSRGMRHRMASDVVRTDVSNFIDLCAGLAVALLQVPNRG